MFSLPIISALLGVFIAQFLKIPIHLIMERKLKPSLFFSTGGMPSSHTATVVSLATSVGLLEGFDSTFFAISAILAIIVMHDATGVRRHAGQHAAILNDLLRDFRLLKETVNPNLERNEKEQKLKELLGHKPIEVFFGAILGIIIGVAMYYIYPF
jgi:uncharacterized protein